MSAEFILGLISIIVTVFGAIGGVAIKSIQNLNKTLGQVDVKFAILLERADSFEGDVDELKTACKDIGVIATKNSSRISYIEGELGLPKKGA